MSMGMYYRIPIRNLYGIDGCIFGVDFGCFSTSYGHCEGLREREEQVIFTLFYV